MFNDTWRPNMDHKTFNYLNMQYGWPGWFVEQVSRVKCFGWKYTINLFFIRVEEEQMHLQQYLFQKLH